MPVERELEALFNIDSDSWLVGEIKSEPSIISVCSFISGGSDFDVSTLDLRGFEIVWPASVPGSTIDTDLGKELVELCAEFADFKEDFLEWLLVSFNGGFEDSIASASTPSGTVFDSNPTFNIEMDQSEFPNCWTLIAWIPELCLETQ